MSMRASELLARAQAAQADYQRDLAALVAIDSGSDDPEGVNRVADWVEARLGHLGFAVSRSTLDPAYGDLVVGRRRGTGQGTVVLFAHMDTVFQRGDSAARPFRIDDEGRAHGPGVTDDKAGVVAGLHAAAHLIDAGAESYGELVLVFTPDEEAGSPVGGPALQEAALGADVALCLECARENGDLVLARKGSLDLVLEVTGLAAHSGIEPERGVHAGLEAAHLTVFLQALADPAAQLTVNVGMLRSGERTNVVPDRAVLHVEARAASAAVLDGVLDRIRRRCAEPVVAGARVAVREVEHCPPMEPGAEGRRLGELGLEIAAGLGFEPALAHTGGVSDANRVAALGVPTLDGLGPVGGGDHSPLEWLDLASVPQRVAMLATLIHDAPERLRSLVPSDVDELAQAV